MRELTFAVRQIYGNRFGVFINDILDIHFPNEEQATKYKDAKEKRYNCEHVWQYEKDEYGSLANGGSYELYTCTECGSTHYSPMAD